jgi:uncharacterized membrane protein YccC
VLLSDVIVTGTIAFKMILRTEKKTWSREVASIRQRISGRTDNRFLTPEKRAMLSLAFKTAVAAGISYWIAQLAGFKDGYWGAISAIIVLQSNVGSTVTASRDRLIGTLIGAGFGAIFSLLGESAWIYLLTVITAMVTCSLLGLKNSSRLAAVTVTIIMLVHRTGNGFWSNWILPMHRVFEVLLGIIVALAIATLVFPSRARARLRAGIAQEILLLSALLQSIMQEFRGNSVPGLPQIWKDTEASQETNAQLLAAARNEPTSSSASLEGLSLLHQFTREVADVLGALELAANAEDVTTGYQQSYIMQLEPEIGNLTRDLCLSLDSLARSVHQWKFDASSETPSLQNGVTLLDEKMAQMRSRVLEFPQPEIFRAYAMQLHLKQLARILQNARNETVKAAL